MSYGRLFSCIGYDFIWDAFENCPFLHKIKQREVVLAFVLSVIEINFLKDSC